MAAVEAHRLERHAKGLPTGPDDFVFTAKTGRPVGASTLRNNSYTRLIQAAGVRPVSFHAIRHTNGSLLLSAGVNVKVIAARLGQKDAFVFLQRYAHLMDGDEVNAANSIAHIFNPPPSPKNVQEYVLEPNRSMPSKSVKPTMSASKSRPQKSSPRKAKKRDK